MKVVSRQDFVSSAIADIRPAHTVLDIGPGIRPQTLVNCLVHVCIEPYRPYAERLTADHPGLVVLNCTWAEALDILPEKSVDTIVLMDVIEHLEKEEGTTLLAATVRLARSQVVVQTPLGFMPQGDNETVDAWGMGGVDWQVHRSGWQPEDFPGWAFIVCDDFHTEDAYGNALDTPHGAFFAILDVGRGYDDEAVHGWAEQLVAEARQTREQYERSLSWRVTKPLRILSTLVRTVLGSRPPQAVEPPK